MPLTRGHTCEYLNENLLLNSVLIHGLHFGGGRLPETEPAVVYVGNLSDDLFLKQKITLVR